VPVLFAAYRKWELFRSQNAFEEGFLRLLKALLALLPSPCHVVVLADAGFARTELMRTLQELGLSYVTHRVDAHLAGARAQLRDPHALGCVVCQ